LLRIEYELQAPDIVIFIRDLDALETDRKARRKRQVVFSFSNSIVDHKGISLLNIFEIEALILADIEAFNRHYETTIAAFTDPMLILEPKEVLIAATRGFNNRFEVSHNPHLFTLLNFDTVKQNCRYFSAFIRKLNRAIS